MLGKPAPDPTCPADSADSADPPSKPVCMAVYRVKAEPVNTLSNMEQAVIDHVAILKGLNLMLSKDLDSYAMLGPQSSWEFWCISESVAV